MQFMRMIFEAMGTRMLIILVKVISAIRMDWIKFYMT